MISLANWVCTSTMGLGAALEVSIARPYKPPPTPGIRGERLPGQARDQRTQPQMSGSGGELIGPPSRAPPPWSSQPPCWAGGPRPLQAGEVGAPTTHRRATAGPGRHHERGLRLVRCDRDQRHHRRAHVVVCARRAEHEIVTSDPDDLHALDRSTTLADADLDASGG